MEIQANRPILPEAERATTKAKPTTSESDTQTVIIVSPKRILQIMTIIAICFFVISYVGVVIIHPYSDARNTEGGLAKLVARFDLSVESNFPSWYAGAILLISSIILALIASDKNRTRNRFRWHWIILAGVFLVLSLDEITFLHERLGEQVSGLQQLITNQAAWAIPGSIFVIVVGLIFTPFILNLPPQTRRLVILAAGLYVGGALVLELAEGYLHRFYVNDSFVILTINQIEDLLEMLGVTLFIYALLTYLRDSMKPVSLTIRQ